MDADPLERAVKEVVDNELCTGCGVCPLVSDRIRMVESNGFLRPEVTAGPDAEASESAKLFLKSCPGVGLRADPSEARQIHPELGPYVEAWEGYAADPEIRFHGSSGGVLTALAEWLRETGRVTAVRSVAPVAPTRVESSWVEGRADAIRRTGSRYQPAAAAEGLRRDDHGYAFVGKPCEVAGLKKASQLVGGGPAVTLSFFCAGTPSFGATDRVIEALGVNRDDVVGTRYRGDGWPGNFRATLRDGSVAEMSYARSWGEILGRDLQWRCKLCVDGTGEFADIAVGDFWQSDADGYPVFDEQSGRSVVIARTEKGASVVREALASGVVHLEPMSSLDAAAAMQPLQVERRRTLPFRLVGRRLAGFRIPRYVGFHFRNVLANVPLGMRTAAGTFYRSRKAKR